MNITINITEPIKRVQEFREYDLGQITTTLQDLLDNSSITIESNIIPILKVLSVDNIIKNYLIKDLTENLYNTQDYITGQDLTEDDLILFVSESQILDLQNKPSLEADGKLVGAYIPGTQFTLPATEDVSNTSANSSFIGFGLVEKMTSDVVFNKVLLPITSILTSGTVATLKVVVRNTRAYEGVFSTVFEPFKVFEMALTQEHFGKTTDKSTLIDLGSYIKVAANKELYFFISSNANSIKHYRFNTNNVAATRHDYTYSNATNPFTTGTWLAAQGIYGFYQVGFKLYNQNNNSNYDARLASLEYKPTIICPDKFTAVVGKELNIYYDSLIKGLDSGLTSPSNLYIDLQCPTLQNATNLVGVRMDRQWQILGSLLTSTYIGNHTLYIKVYDNNGNLVSSKTCTIQVVNAAPIAVAKNILHIGDSITANGSLVSTSRGNLVALGGTTPTFRGTQGTAPNNHEGRSGWTFSSFVTAGSPFWNPATSQVDFAYYRSQIGFSGYFDVVPIMLGTNDSIADYKDMTSSLNNAILLVSKILEDAAAGSYTTKVILQLPPTDANTTSSWQVYSDTSYGRKAPYQSNIWQLRKKLYDEFTKPAYSGLVYIGQAITNIDRYYGYPYANRQVSERIIINEVFHTNSVHPNTNGYQQLGDGYFLQLLGLLSS